MSGEALDTDQDLFGLDESLRAEAARVLADSGIGAILREEGFHAVGSYVMRTMTWRDLDFERHQDPPDWEAHWALGTKLARTRWVWRASCIDAYRDPRNQDQGFYWGLRACDPAGGPVWKLDLWTARAEEFERATPNRQRWTSLLTNEARLRILAIKQRACALPEYRDTMLSVHIYEAVLDHHVRDFDGFVAWWQERRAKR